MLYMKVNQLISKRYSVKIKDNYGWYSQEEHNFDNYDKALTFAMNYNGPITGMWGFGVKIVDKKTHTHELIARYNWKTLKQYL